MKLKEFTVRIKQVIDDGRVSFHIAEPEYKGYTVWWPKSKWVDFIDHRERYNDYFLELKNEFNPPKDTPIGRRVVSPGEVVRFD